jgi:hypothetical protein
MLEQFQTVEPLFVVSHLCCYYFRSLELHPLPIVVVVVGVVLGVVVVGVVVLGVVVVGTIVMIVDVFVQKEGDHLEQEE